MRIDIIESHEALLALKSNWDDVYAQDAEAHFFLSWTWLSRWLEGDTSQWFILAAAPDAPGSAYVAFFPLRLRTKMRKNGGFYNVLGLAGRGLSDYTGLISLPEHEKDAIDAFGRYLRASDWAAISLEFFRASPARMEHLLRHFPEKDFRTTAVATINKRDDINNSVCPLLTLPSDWESYLGSLGSNTRQKMRRFLRKVDAGELTVTVADAQTIERDLDILLDFWRIKWTARKGDRIPRLMKANRAMFMAAFEAGALFVPVIWQGERPLGALASYIDSTHKAVLFFMGARDETLSGGPPAGFILHAFSIRHLIEQGFHTYDFLRGNEAYKYLFGVKDVVLNNYTITTLKKYPLGAKLDPRCVLKVLGKAIQLHQTGRIDQAEWGYRQVLAITPRSAAALYGYGQLLAKKGDHRAAVRVFRKLVAMKPDERNALLRLGVSLEAGKRFSEAAKVYREIVKRQPSDKAVCMKLGRVLLALGKKEEAGFVFETAAGVPRANNLRLN